MRRLLILLVFAWVAVGAQPAGAVVLKTNWVEKQSLTTGKGSIKLIVRWIEVRGGTWRASVGMTNKSSVKLALYAREMRSGGSSGNDPYSFYAGPGMWWQTYEPGTSWWPDSGTSITHCAKADGVAPKYPSSLAPGKSWYGIFSGSTAKVPKDRLLRIGFGYVIPNDGRGATVVLSTTHQFRLPPTR